MTKNSWQVIDGILCLVDETKIYVPTANEIYSAVFEKGTNNSQFTPEVAKGLKKGISFSKYPAQLAIVLLIDDRKVIYSIQARAGNARRVFFDLDIQDHIVIDNIWYPLVESDRKSILDVLSSHNISKLGPITFGNYMNLSKRAEENDFIINEVNSDDIELNCFIDTSTGQLPDVKATLYPYQKDGWRWLQFMFQENIGGILADEMGLGKTLQVIALFSTKFHDDKVFPSLIISPSTLLENWRRELNRFAPNINCIVHQGANRTGFPNELKNFDIIITSYDTAVRDNSLLNQINWKIVICDEAQAIKNPDTKRARGIKKINRKTGFAVTGTPVENSLQDLWSIMDFAVPGFLEGRHEFDRKYAQDINGALMLEKVITPLILRRRVLDVAKDLPSRVDVPQVVDMLPSEIEEYERIRQQTITEFESNASLVVLSRLRMFCAHPFLLNNEPRVNPEHHSNKYTRLVEISDEIFQNGAKLLIFTSYNGMSDIIVSDFIKRFDIYASQINGRTIISERQKLVDEFSSIQGPAVLVLNPKAAGSGLNITAANHVIHYNLEWNPAVEDQASARAYRRGQDRPVTIHRLFYGGTVEEAINERLQRKRELAEMTIIGSEGTEEEYKDLINALNIKPH